MTLIRNRVNQGSIFCSFIDFRKAFDYVDRQLSYFRLADYGIVGNILNLIQQMYTRTMNSVRVNNRLSSEFESKLGVKRGDNLSPNLFSGFINDLIVKLKASGLGIAIDNDTKICMLAYADDIVLIADSLGELQKFLDIVEKWCANWRIKVNTEKTKIIQFRKKTVSLTELDFFLNGELLEKVDNYKYLGINMNCFLDCNTIVDQLANAGSKALGSIIGKTKSNYDLSLNTFSKLFNATILPTLNYGLGAWSTGTTNCKKFDQIQQRAIRYFCGLPKNCALLGLEGDVGWTPGVVERDLETLRLYNQICRMNDSRTTKKIYLFDKTHLIMGSWNKNVKSLLESLGMLQSWQSNTCISIKMAKEKLLEMYRNTWKEECSKKVNYLILQF